MNKNEESVDEVIRKKFQCLYKKKNGEKKDILQRDEKRFRHNFAGTERSPYNDYRERKGNHNQENDMVEPPESSLEGVREDQGIFFDRSTKVRESEDYEKILKILPNLTKRQREILRIVGYEGRSFSECANILKISKSTVQKIVERIRGKIRGGK